MDMPPMRSMEPSTCHYAILDQYLHNELPGASLSSVDVTDQYIHARQTLNMIIVALDVFADEINISRRHHVISQSEIFINPSKLNDIAVMLATYVESNYYDARDYSGFYCDVALHAILAGNCVANMFPSDQSPQSVINVQAQTSACFDAIQNGNSLLIDDALYVELFGDKPVEMQPRNDIRIALKKLLSGSISCEELVSLLNRRQLLASLLLRLQIRLRQTVKKLEARPEIKINVLKSEFESFVEQYAVERVVRLKNAEDAYFRDEKRLKLDLSSSMSSSSSSSSEYVTTNPDITTITTTMPSEISNVAPVVDLVNNRSRRGRGRPPQTQPSESQSQSEDQIAPAMVTRRSRRGLNAVVADTVALSENETALATNSLLELALGDINSPSDNTNSLEGLVYRDPLESGAGEFFHCLIAYSSKPLTLLAQQNMRKLTKTRMHPTLLRRYIEDEPHIKAAKLAKLA